MSDPAAKEKPGPTEAKKTKIIVGEDFSPQIVDLEGGSSVRFEDGVIRIDRKAFEAERKGVEQWIRDSFLTGNEKALTVIMRNLDEGDHYSQEELEAMKAVVENAFKEQNPDLLKLGTLEVELPTGGIAERNLIRKGLESELSRLPFIYLDANGGQLSADDLAILFSRKEGSNQGYKLIIGSTRGIDSVKIPDEIPSSMFRPDKQALDKDKVRDLIIIPILASADGVSPTATVIEVRKGVVDLAAELHEKEIEEARRSRQTTRTFQPSKPSPSSGRWTSSSG